MFHKLDNYETHVKTCEEGERMLVLPGKYYRDTKSIFEKLAEYVITTHDPYFAYFAVNNYAVADSWSPGTAPYCLLNYFKNLLIWHKYVLTHGGPYFRTWIRN